MIPWLSDDEPLPPVANALRRPNGLLAAGGGLSVRRLVDAYAHGCFPWYSDGEPVLWDVVPQMQVTLSKRQHIMINAGVRLPLNERNSRRTQVLAYFLWDWFDGGLFDGWR